MNNQQWVLRRTGSRRYPAPASYLQYFNELYQGLTVRRTFITRAGAEHAVLAPGEEVRLDRITRLNDIPAPTYADYPDYRGNG